jgi:hypothetical protein
MKEIVINKCWGGFGLSHEAMMLYSKLSGTKLYPFVDERESGGKEWSPLTHKSVPYVNEESKSSPFDLIFYSTKPLKKNGTYEKDSYFSDDDIKRDDKNLVKVVKKLKDKANGYFAELRVVEIPDDVEWEIDDYDGMESIEEVHKSWG